MWGTRLAIGAAAWAGVLVVSVVTGGVLGRAVTRAADSTSHVVATPSAVWGANRAIIRLLCLLFALTVPLILASAVVATVLAVRWMIVADVDFKPIALVVLVGILMVLAVGRGLFARGATDVGFPALSPMDFPELWQATQRVAGRVGASRVERICISDGVEVSVISRGGLLRQLSRRDTTLVIGLGLLDGLASLELEALIGAELGYRAGVDVAGGVLALAARHSIARATMDLAVAGMASALSPVWLSMRIFDASFRVVSDGAVSLQEAVSDRRAVLVCGARSFERGLLHLVDRAEQDAREHGAARASAYSRVIQNLHQQQIAVGRLATPHAALLMDDTALARAIAAARDAVPDSRRSRTSANARLARLRSMRARDDQPEIDRRGERDAWSLFSRLRQLEAGGTESGNDGAPSA